MASLRKVHRRLLLAIADAIRTGERDRCLVSDIAGIENARVLLSELVGMNLVSVSGDYVTLTAYGWSWICAIIPAIIRRGKK